MSLAFMIQGTGSNVGKSLIVAGLCRVFARRGLRVLPFKPQNMSNNAAVTLDGGEIGRAQALQAKACKVVPRTDMNPLLLKPEGEGRSQIILCGKRIASLSARDYFSVRSQFMPDIMKSFNRLMAEADLVLVEGAGSPAEVNLRAGDQANMGFAAAADIPVFLVGDIHRGGVIASIAGTISVLDPEDTGRIFGFIINNFRGDVTLFEEGIRIIRDRTALPCLGVIPHFPDAGKLPAEDSMILEQQADGFENLHHESNSLHIVVPCLPAIANFDDLDPLRLHTGVKIHMVQPGQVFPANADLVILPGSKATMKDLAFFREQGWDIDLQAHVRRGGHVLGLCGGYQILGNRLSDPDRIEGNNTFIQGLGLLDVDTVLTQDKILAHVQAIHSETGCSFEAYEMHIGRTGGADCHRPFARIVGGQCDGAQSRDGRIAGTYLHGLFASDAFRIAYLRSFRSDIGAGEQFDHLTETILDRLADHMESHVDLDRMMTLAKNFKGRKNSYMSQSPGISSAPKHGGDLHYAESLRTAQSRKTDWLDLSTGINPNPWPVPGIAPASWHALPDCIAQQTLLETARVFYNLPKGAGLVAGSGTEIFIAILPYLFPTRRVQILVPTYGSYGSAWQKVGHHVEEISRLEEADPSALVILVNPNNPDGRSVSSEKLGRFIEAMRHFGGFLLVDEAYADVLPGCSAIPFCPDGGVVVLRSFGKFFGLAGVRLGFAVASQDLVSRMESALGDWPVSGPALSIGTKALLDTDWHKRTRKQLEKLSLRLRSILSQNGLEIIGGTTLFTLARVRNAESLFRYLLEKGIYVRFFPYAEEWLRFGLPACQKGLDRLHAALKEWR